MIDTKKKPVDEMLSIIDEAKEMINKLQDMSDRVDHLRTHTEIGDYVNFHRNRGELFEKAMINLNFVIDTEDSVKAINEIEEQTFAIGDVVILEQRIRVNLDSQIDMIKGYGAYSAGDTFVVLDQQGMNYTLKKTEITDKDLIFATQDQMNVFFKNAGFKTENKWVKLEFILNGPLLEYATHLQRVTLYTGDVREKLSYEKDRWNYGYNYAHDTVLFNITVDEAFGITGTAYFKGVLSENYENIIFQFGKKMFKMGFTQTKIDKDIYKYNGKISVFMKEKGKHGEHYFPKDVLIKSQTGRVTNILELKQQY